MTRKGMGISVIRAARVDYQGSRGLVIFIRAAISFPVGQMFVAEPLPERGVVKYSPTLNYLFALLNYLFAF